MTLTNIAGIGGADGLMDLDIAVNPENFAANLDPRFVGPPEIAPGARLFVPPGCQPPCWEMPDGDWGRPCEMPQNWSNLGWHNHDWSRSPPFERAGRCEPCREDVVEATGRTVTTDNGRYIQLTNGRWVLDRHFNYEPRPGQLGELRNGEFAPLGGYGGPREYGAPENFWRGDYPREVGWRGADGDDRRCEAEEHHHHHHDEYAGTPDILVRPLPMTEPEEPWLEGLV